MKKEYGYVLPLVVDPAETICFQVNVPKDIYHLAAFMGQLWELAKWYNWQPDDAHTGKEVAAVWAAIYEAVRASADECGVSMFDIRQKTGAPCIIEKSSDGITWVDAVDMLKCAPNIRVNKGVIEWFNPDTGLWEPVESGDERVDGDAPPPYPDDPDGDCLAAENLTAIYQTVITQIRAGVDAGEVAVAIAATVTGILSLFIPAALISTAALAITGIALDAGETYLDGMLDSDSLDHFKCSIFCNIQPDGSVTASDFAAIYADMATWASGLELEMIQFYLDSLGSVGLTRQGRAGGITTGDCSDCDCNPVGILGIHIFVDGVDNAADPAFQPQNPGYGYVGSYGSEIATNEFAFGNGTIEGYSGFDYTATVVTDTFVDGIPDECTCNRWRMYFTRLTDAGSGQPSNLNIYLYAYKDGVGWVGGTDYIALNNPPPLGVETICAQGYLTDPDWLRICIHMDAQADYTCRFEVYTE